MICSHCKRAADMNRSEFHNLCLGETHCDCQHMQKGSRHEESRPTGDGGIHGEDNRGTS